MELTKDDFGIINKALNEIYNRVDLEGEFDTQEARVSVWCTLAVARDSSTKTLSRV